MRVGDAPPPPGAWPLLAAELAHSKGAGLHLFTNSKTKKRLFYHSVFCIHIFANSRRAAGARRTKVQRHLGPGRLRVSEPEFDGPPSPSPNFELAR